MGQICSKGRKLAPSDYILKIDTFSSLVSSVYKYESRVFEASGYKWKLLLFPNYMRGTNENFMSLSLEISAKDNALPPGWEINATVNLFVYIHGKDKYSRKYRKLTRFHALKTVCGFHLPYNTFINPFNGFVMNDCCAFGVEVFVVNNQGKGETMSLKRAPSILNTLTWKIHKFSQLTNEYHCSNNAFSWGGCEWKLGFYPKGYGQCKGKSVSMFLCIHNPQKLSPEWKMLVSFKLRIRNQVSDKHKEGTYSYNFSAAASICGTDCNFLPLSDLNNPSKGYAVEDTLILQAEVIAFAEVKDLA